MQVMLFLVPCGTNMFVECKGTRICVSVPVSVRYLYFYVEVVVLADFINPIVNQD